MFLPLGDDGDSHRVPAVNYAIIAANGLVFALVNVLGGEATTERIIGQYGLVPADLELHQVFTCMFLHAGWFHLIGNMWFLWIFGDRVENRLGHLGYLAFYLVSGIGAAGFYLLFTPKTLIPCVGASGAIFGVVGAYAVLYPSNQIKMFYWMGWVWAGTFHVRAFWIIGFWFLEQVGLWWLTSQLDMIGGIAYAAHLGGGIVGGLIALGVRVWLPEGEDEAASVTHLDGPGVWSPTSTFAPPPSRLEPLRATRSAFAEGPAGEPLDEISGALADGNVTRALDLYRQHASCRPGVSLAPASQSAVAAILFERAEFDEALEAYRTYLGRSASGADAPLAKFRAGVILSRRKEKFDEASRLLLQAVMEHPDPAVVSLAREELNRIRQLA
jgi:membrane associated rhomboid family serine protease